jgi:hypothetical protein
VFEKDEGGREYAEKERQRLGSELGEFQMHMGVLEAKLRRLANEPRSMFLPLGTLVRFRDVAHYTASDSVFKASETYPASGTLAVVTGLRLSGEYPIAVSICWPFRDGYGTQWEPEEDRLMTYFVDPESVEVVGYATFPDGREFRGFCFTPTHKHKQQTGTNREVEMLLLSNGYYWRLHDFGGRQGIEALSATTDVVRTMPWIEGPIA